MGMGRNPTAVDVAQLLVFWANRDGDPITHLKLQKLIYYAEAWHLVNFSGSSLFSDPIEAWELGPVIPSVWREYRDCGGNPIIMHGLAGQPTTTAPTESSLVKPFNKRQRHYLTRFYNFFHRFSAHELVSLTHRGDPWRRTRRNQNISRKLMKEFYEEEYRKQARQRKHA